MLAVHIKSTPDTEDFSRIYKDLGSKILVNPSRKILEEEIGKEENIVILIGHGTEYGLFCENLETYLIDSANVGLLKNRLVIGIWCYAGNFADRHNLKGFFTSNFISNREELISAGFCSEEAAEESEFLIRSENIKFAKKINKLLLEKIDLKNWNEELHKDLSNFSFVQYNYEAFYIETYDDL